LPRHAVGRHGPHQLLLRSQGPRGPAAIDCPVKTPNQSPFPFYAHHRRFSAADLVPAPFFRVAHPCLILTELKGIIPAMSYKTLEVELENGRVHPAGAETLPDKAHALLTILSPQAVKPEAPAKSLGKAMRELGVIGRGEFTDLSTNPRHMDDFGK
jgi:hypothetical protein